jgi:hypothetical protein
MGGAVVKLFWPTKIVSVIREEVPKREEKKAVRVRIEYEFGAEKKRLDITADSLVYPANGSLEIKLRDGMVAMFAVGVWKSVCVLPTEKEEKDTTSQNVVDPDLRDTPIGSGG